jgi:hypothetical protein
VHNTQIYTKVGAHDLIKIAEATSLSEQLITRRRVFADEFDSQHDFARECSQLI